ncbi:dockerin type I domain-containing protein [Novipirellula artificiosorum]|uniref:Uncharacterized protein n=1 Tax=Novipirellula artificiosorum TaxID=2528016 RepID=A0A5C6DZX9_9BACT|nr:dockerin type I domain-containing protein [Novipirellula artificiosorum]TWU42182.1 hypothetical protein Poly41_04780 [Novipirellula artificiosorum]
MPESHATWKRVTMSLRSLGAVLPQDAVSYRMGEPLWRQLRPQRQLRMEHLHARELLAGDSFADASLQYTAGATIAAEIAGAGLPDLNNDGELTPADALRIANAIEAGWSLSQIPAADLNQDNQLDGNDFDAAIAAIEADRAAQAATAAAQAASAFDCRLDYCVVTGGESESSSDGNSGGDSGGIWNEGSGTGTWNGSSEGASGADSGGIWDEGSGDGCGGDSGAGSGTWDQGTWDGSTWDGSGWDGSSWDGSSWDGSSWDGSSWDGSSWDGSSWDGSSGVSGDDSGDGSIDGSSWGASEGDSGGESGGASSGDTGEVTGAGTGVGGDTSGGDTGSGSGSDAGGSSGGGTQAISPTSFGTGTGVAIDGSTGANTGGGYTSGGDTGGSDSSVSGGQTSATKFYIKGYTFGAYSGGVSSPQGDRVHEGESLEVTVEIDGPRKNGQLLPPPDLILRADTNFDGNFDDNGETVFYDLDYFRRPSLDPAGHSEIFSSWFFICDDGPWYNANHTPQDTINLEFDFGETQTASATVLNVIPRFDSRPTLSFGRSDQGNDEGIVRADFVDPGHFDSHSLEVKWGEQGTTETGLFSYEAMWPFVTTLEAKKELESGLDSIYPVELTLKDDDTGEIGYAFDKLDVTLNNNDDNQDGSDDLFDRGFVDPDLRELSLEALLSESMNATDGRFEFRYDLQSIRVWTSADKAALILPFESGQDDRMREWGGGVAYAGQETVWVEGISLFSTTITLDWRDNASLGADADTGLVFGGEVAVNVGGIDVDIDSDNNDGFAFPEGSEWEEYLEANDYGIGKMLQVGAAQFTPVRITLPVGLAPVSYSLSFEEIDAGPESGTIRVWNTDKSMFGPNPDDVADGGNRVSMNRIYRLSELGYDGATGEIELYLEATSVRKDHYSLVGSVSHLGVDDYGKPDTRLRAHLIGYGVDNLYDDVKWMVVEPNSFYPTVQSKPELRSAFAAQLVYGYKDPKPGSAGPGGALPIDATEYVMKRLTEEEVRELIEKDLKQKDIDYVLGTLFSKVPAIGSPPIGVPGLQVALYRDHVSGRYVLSFAGTEDLRDWLTNLTQLLVSGEAQHYHSIWLTYLLSQVHELDGFITTGQSLGGGLASAAALGSGIHADTFNASGVQRHTFEEIGGSVGFPEDFSDNALAAYDSDGEKITAYNVNWIGADSEGRWHAPDVLTFLQRRASFAPTAVGIPVTLEGLYELSPNELRLVETLGQAISGLDLSDPIDEKTLQDLVAAIFYATADGATDAFGKLVESHRFPSIYYGLLHSSQWDVYFGR